jgi:hypothetical protein
VHGSGTGEDLRVHQVGDRTQPRKVGDAINDAVELAISP